MLVGEAITAEDVARIDPEFVKHQIEPLLKPGGVQELGVSMCVFERIPVYFNGKMPLFTVDIWAVRCVFLLKRDHHLTSSCRGCPDAGADVHGRG